ncbi:hypothetical protein CW304_19490 [Bacillus sp. UFRGS-B20]|nr:hypothetical protein CW304_19490 [Bacillus sp. UFRGS-B20]
MYLDQALSSLLPIIFLLSCIILLSRNFIYRGGSLFHPDCREFFRYCKKLCWPIEPSFNNDIQAIPFLSICQINCFTYFFGFYVAFLIKA